MTTMCIQLSKGEINMKRLCKGIILFLCGLLLIGCTSTEQKPSAEEQEPYTLIVNGRKLPVDPPFQESEKEKLMWALPVVSVFKGIGCKTTVTGDIVEIKGDSIDLVLDLKNYTLKQAEGPDWDYLGALPGDTIVIGDSGDWRRSGDDLWVTMSYVLAALEELGMKHNIKRNFNDMIVEIDLDWKPEVKEIRAAQKLYGTRDHYRDARDKERELALFRQAIEESGLDLTAGKWYDYFIEATWVNGDVSMAIADVRVQQDVDLNLITILVTNEAGYELKLDGYSDDRLFGVFYCGKLYYNPLE